MAQTSDAYSGAYVAALRRQREAALDALADAEGRLAQSEAERDALKAALEALKGDGDEEPG